MASTSLLAHVVAHQGGWDEMALVAAPIVVMIALLALAKRRVDRNAAKVMEHVDEPGKVGDGR